MFSDWCIARDSLKSAYNRDIERVRKKEIFYDGNNVEYKLGRAGGRKSDVGGETRSKAGAERRRKAAATAMMAAPESGRKRATEDPSVRKSNGRAGGKYRLGGKGQEESAEESVKWSGEDMEGSVTEDNAETAKGAREVIQVLTAMA